ncbi:MAG: Gfo/Idh/MocA family protein [Promethearchaeota archaeon]
MAENKTLKKGPVIAAMIGAGLRGRDSYGRYALKYPDRLKFVAVAEPDEVKRRVFQKQHNISDDLAFSSWQDMLSSRTNLPDEVQVIFVCTPDRMHYEPAMRVIGLGFGLVLEKPIAPTLEECKNIEELAREKNAFVQICHPLRFTHFFLKLKEIIDSGRIGKIIHYDHSENVSYWHFGHSFVRGPYKNKGSSSPLILAKTCHDLDIIHWLMGEKAEIVESFGELTFYKEENAPPDAPLRCTDGCPYEKTCPWYAPRLYIEAEPLIRIGTEVDSKLIKHLAEFIIKHRNFAKKLSKIIKPLKKVVQWDEFPATHITTDFSDEAKWKALQEGPYGLCIFKCHNDVVDHQVVNIKFPSGRTAILQVHGLSEHEGREIRIFGTKGTIRGYFRGYGEKIEVTDFRYRKTEVVYKSSINVESAHGGGDKGLMDAFTSYWLGEKTKEEAGITDISSAMESHYMAFAIEDSRVEKSVKAMDEYRLKRS